MTKVKIISNPYKQEIDYAIYEEKSDKWIDIHIYSLNGRLREEKQRKCFFTFNVKQIIQIIIDEYYIESKGPVELIFEGTKEEFDELLKISLIESFENKVEVVRSNRVLDNGKYILSDTKEIFLNVKPIIEEVIKDEREIEKNLLKVTDALDDIIPICIFGNYSAGKSTFINSLIGREVLPSGGDPVTAKTFKIENSPCTDIAKIKFTHWDNKIELVFEDDSYRVLKGDTDEMIKELDDKINEIEIKTMDKIILSALSFINAYEKRDMTSLEIGNMIELQIPFSRKGILGQSNNKYVIFDTPGSNTATNDGHIQVLKEALEDFSNGIPVWVTQYETLDTMDNEALCNNILGIDALDKRFTMIVLNKADVSDLPEKGFNEKQLRNIKEYKSVEKMYSTGIFFVSSIMGLGAKNNGKLSDKYYRKIYKLQTNAFSDIEDEDYMTLYKYNIMPSQIKEEVEKYSQEEKNVIYVNSGLHCIETEIEEFASKYSAYNKCQMVYALLSDVINKTTQKISKRVEARKNLRNKYINDLEEKKQQLINTMREKSEEFDNKFLSNSYESINVYAKNNLNYNLDLKQLNDLNERYVDQKSDEYSLSDKKKNFDNAVGNMFSNIKSGIKKISMSDIKESINSMAQDTKKSVKTIIESKKDLDKTQKDASQEAVDNVLNDVIELYKTNMIDATNKVNHIACNYWINNSKLLKDELIDIVSESDALTDKQKEDLSKIIFNYSDIEYNDNAKSVFIKPKFLIGHLLGLDLFMFEKLNVNKLTKEYNKTVQNNLQNISDNMNENYHNSYKKWQSELSAMIEKNIVDLNPELQVISETIYNETEIINRLETSQQEIKNALSEIKKLMSFRVIEEH